MPEDGAGRGGSGPTHMEMHVAEGAGGALLAAAKLPLPATAQTPGACTMHSSCTTFGAWPVLAYEVGTPGSSPHRRPSLASCI